MKRFLFLIILIAFAGCGDSIKGTLDKQLMGVDKVKIYFTNIVPTKDTATEQRAIITITNLDTVNMLAQSITDETSEFYKCGYTGTIEFFKDNISISNMQFNLMNECNHIVFRVKDNIYSKKISDKGIEVLNNYYKTIN
ncbi:MAG TPA: hypothetical protein VHP32_04205 [Ignavibacteria bacterium]|nr:hypothetical protein [Ignavibacteria bacterium]